MPTLHGNAARSMIDAEWPKAVASAGFRDDQVSLWQSEATPSDDVVARCFPPFVFFDEPHGLTAQQYAEATSEALEDRHRIVINLGHDYPDLSAPALQALVGGVLRHELEHARQVEVWGPDLYNLYAGFIHPAVARTLGLTEYPGEIRNAEPVEVDANAAAAVFLRELHPEQVTEIAESPEGQFADSTAGPQSRRTLVRRSMEFLFQYREAIEELCEGSVDAHLEPYCPEAAEVWRLLTA